MEVPARLPQPTPDECAASDALCRLIGDEIDRAGGFLSFERYMDLALFAPGFGYYVGGTHKFGAGGDFVTAPEVSLLFGRAIARHWQRIARPDDEVLEFGGGSGRLALGFLAALAEDDALPARYTIVELSPELRERQQALLHAQPWANGLALQWLAGPPSQPIRGLVLANEVLDAIPACVFEVAAEGLLERGVRRDGSGFGWCHRPAPEALRTRFETDLAPLDLDTGFRGELNLRQALWVRELRQFMREGVALLFDYGEPRRELYHPSRAHGTLRCFYRHRLMDDPFWRPGLQDITTSVDFTAVGEAALDAGMSVLGYANQASFLLAGGIEQAIARVMEETPEVGARLALEARQLLLPNAMGTVFKSMALGIGIDGPLAGFALRDERVRL